jgi:glutamine cyclotransferase
VRWFRCLIAAALVTLATFALIDARAQASVPVLGFQTVKVYPHDPRAFTQGLVYHNGVLFESTGQYGQSDVRKVEIETGKVLQRARVPDQHFAEGLAMVGERLIQLTWQTQTGFVYDRDSFKLIRTWTYPTEGWGLAFDGKRLILSDGTPTLYFLDPTSFRRLGSVTVTGPDGPVKNLNELEVIDELVYANIWQTDRIARIDPRSGKVTAFIDLAGLLPRTDLTAGADVLNGIAYDEKNRRLFVTGKYWPFLFQINPVAR